MRTRFSWKFRAVIGFVCCIGAMSVGVNAAIQPVWTDGWTVAGNRTIGTAVRYMRLGMWPEAEAELRKTLGYRPENHAAQYNLGICYERRGDRQTALRFYEKAVDLRPENLYCEGIARLTGVAGRGAEFLKFLPPCSRECEFGYAFARAGLWERALERYMRARAIRASSESALHIAVAYEVLENRRDAVALASEAAQTKTNAYAKNFLNYITTAPPFTLDLLITLPELTTITDASAIDQRILESASLTIRMQPGLDSPVVAQLSEPRLAIDVIAYTGSWARIRTRQKEGYVPAFILDQARDTTVSGFSLPVPPDDNNHSDTTPVVPGSESVVPGELIAAIDPPVIQTRVIADGDAVAVREEPSLLAEIVGYVDPGKKLTVTRTEDPIWVEITAGASRGFIMTRYLDLQLSESESGAEPH
ncbi:SH3 domain-containing protein [bacterium]|nr:SH3 domain-containing protein [candidate division CSSED10-310 bacterium]